MLDEVTYCFIDGGYLRKVHEVLFQSVFGDSMSLDFSLVKLVEAYPHTDSRRAFYYDCIDNIPRKATGSTPAETEVDCDVRVRRQEEILDRIEAVPGMQVRQGYLTVQKKRGRVQKQVDVLLAVDMLNNAVRRNMTRAVLIAGDGDFVPVVQAVKEYGTYVVLVSELASTAPELRRTADEHRAITLEQLCRWTINQVADGAEYNKRFPQFSYERGASHGAIMANKMPNGRGFVEKDGLQYEVSEWWLETGNLILVRLPQDRIATYRFADPVVLRRYAEAFHGPITWIERPAGAGLFH